MLATFGGVEIEYRRGRLLCQRVGPLNPTRQRELTRGPGGCMEVVGRRNSRAPERKGIWAFPFPLMDLYFTIYQERLAIPKRFHVQRAELVESWQGGSIDQEAFYEGMDAVDERVAAWSRTDAGRSRLRVRKFWVSGVVYTHLHGPRGDAPYFRGPMRAVAVEEFVDLLRCRAGVSSWTNERPDSDDFELFLGRGARVH